MNCQAELARDTRIVIAKCTNRDGKSAPPVAIQACTELLDRKLLEGYDRFYPFVNSAKAYFVRGDKQHALDDYNTAIKVAPKKAQPYDRAVFYTLQTDGAAALRDLDTALSIDPQFVLAAASDHLPDRKESQRRARRFLGGGSFAAKNCGVVERTRVCALVTT